MRRTFVEFSAVTRAFADHGVSDEILRHLQRDIMAGKGVVIRKTGGLRKIRSAAEGRGKSGGVRVVFADYPEAGVCLMVAAFAKNVRENLDAEERHALAKLKKVLDRLYTMRSQNHES